MTTGTSALGPSCWEREKPGSGGRNCNSRHLLITQSGLRIRYIGPGSDDKDAASVRADQPVPPDCPVYYYEVEVLSKGRDGFIGVGFAAADVKLDRLPGWEPRSYGYHGDDGNAFESCGKGRPYGPTFTTGDTIGVAYNRAERTISYFKNGIDLGVAFSGVTEDPLYPAVGLRTPEEEVLGNFGASSFKHSIGSLRRDAAERVQDQIAAMPLPASSQSSNWLGHLVFQYLTHHGHWETASTVAREVLGGSVAVEAGDMEEMKVRAAVHAAVLAGDVDEALRLIEALAPGALDADPHIRFRLHVQRFVEMVRRRDDEAALQVAWASLSGAPPGAEEAALAHEALALLAYEDPASSPCGHLLEPAQRADLAASLNSTILAARGRAEHSALERLVRQLKVLHETLVSQGDAASLLVSPDQVLTKGLAATRP